MAKFKINGGKPLIGSVTPQGCKNEAFQVICAALLTTSPVIIRNVPDILDIRRMINMLLEIGVKIDKIEQDTYRIDASNINIEGINSEAFIKYFSFIRGAVLIMGPVLARFGMVKILKPGGDKIGRRHLDTHILGLSKLGAKYEYDHVNGFFILKADKLVGNYILLDEASVTGTANIIMAACLAEGVTNIYNAACEPPIQQLCKMLNKMGAKISGIGSNLLTIEGVSSLGGTTHVIGPDLLEVGSFIGLSVLTMGDITINNIDIPSLGSILFVFEKIGVKAECNGNSIRIAPHDTYKVSKNLDGSILKISDGTWPNFPADLISILITTAIHANGVLLVHQKMYESRLFFVDILIEMGAQIILCDPHRVNIIGLDRKYHLKNIYASSPDIRAGISLLIAALSAPGESIIDNIEQIDRGYSNIENRLADLGASIQRVN